MNDTVAAWQANLPSCDFEWSVFDLGDVASDLANSSAATKNKRSQRRDMNE